jgi:hypothetical protein
LETLPNLGISSTIIGSFEGVESVGVLPFLSIVNVLSHGQFNHRSSFNHHVISLFHVLTTPKILILYSPTTTINHGLKKNSS